MRKTILVIVVTVAVIVAMSIAFLVKPSQPNIEIPVPSPPPIQQKQPTSTDSKLDSIITLVYGAIGASLVSALASIVCLMQTSQRLG